jgi:hypothetical protein
MTWPVALRIHHCPNRSLGFLLALGRQVRRSDSGQGIPCRTKVGEIEAERFSLDVIFDSSSGELDAASRAGIQVPHDPVPRSSKPTATVAVE